MVVFKVRTLNSLKAEYRSLGQLLANLEWHTLYEPGYGSAVDSLESVPIKI